MLVQVVGLVKFPVAIQGIAGPSGFEGCFVGLGSPFSHLQRFELRLGIKYFGKHVLGALALPGGQGFLEWRGFLRCGPRGRGKRLFGKLGPGFEREFVL